MYADGNHEDALKEQMEVITTLQKSDQLPVLHVDSLSQRARWLENLGRDHDLEALQALKDAEEVIERNEKEIGPESAKAVEVKRDIALLHLKLGDHDTALQYLQ